MQTRGRRWRAFGHNGRQYKLDEMESLQPKNIHFSCDTSCPIWVFLARNFYYLGDLALSLPPALRHLIFRVQGCNRAANDGARQLDAVLVKRFGRASKDTRTTRHPLHGERAEAAAAIRACFRLV